MKRGQLDMVVTSIVVFFVVFFIMAIFVSVTLSIGSIKSGLSFNSIEGKVTNFLTREINVQVGEETSEMFVLEGALGVWRDEIPEENFGESLKSLVNANQPCLQYGDIGGGLVELLAENLWGWIKSRFTSDVLSPTDGLGQRSLDHVYIYEYQDGTVKDFSSIEDRNKKFLPFDQLDDKLIIEFTDSDDIIVIYYYYGECNDG